MNQLNNQDKISPTLYLSTEGFEYEEKLLLWVYVPPTSTVEKCANMIYDRNKFGDMDIKDSSIVTKYIFDKFCLIDNVNTSIRGSISKEVIGKIDISRAMVFTDYT